MCVLQTQHRLVANLGLVSQLLLAFGAIVDLRQNKMLPHASLTSAVEYFQENFPQMKSIVLNIKIKKAFKLNSIV